MASMKRFILAGFLLTSSFASSRLEKTWQLNTTQNLTFEAGKVSGNAGCNNFFGAYTVKSSSLTFGALASTRKACQASIMEQENLFLKRLSSTKRFFVSQDGLRLTLIGDGVQRLTASR